VLAVSPADYDYFDVVPGYWRRDGRRVKTPDSSHARAPGACLAPIDISLAEGNTSMAVEDSSFNSSGDTTVAFQTINSKGVPQIGVSANATDFGVYGEAVAAHGGPPTTPAKTGVLGRGDKHGVYGVSGKIKDADTPDFGFRQLVLGER
jgi:hypothetical protein